MAKRYHESKKSGLDHAADKFNDEVRHDRDGENFSFRRDRMMDGAYAGMEPRRRQELEDAGMIREDHTQVANLPQNVMMKPYPKTGPYNPSGIDDTIRGVDGQMDYDDSKRAEHFFPKKV